MKNKNITISDLAVMVQKGFEETAKKSEMDFGFKQVGKRFDKIDFRLDKIEKLILADHKERIEKLETQVKELKELFAM